MPGSDAAWEKVREKQQRLAAHHAKSPLLLISALHAAQLGSPTVGYLGRSPRAFVAP